MGKVKIKRKSTLIDMTAMSDVTVLLLTFFMLTSTFLQKEPTIVYTPSSVSEEKVPMNNVVTVLVSSADKTGKYEDPSLLEGKIFISFTGDADSTLSSEKIRVMMLDEALNIYNDQHKNNQVQLNAAQKAVFSQTNMFGVPFSELPAMLSMSPTERDKFQGDMANPKVGIPINDNKNYEGNYNDFQVWLKAIYNVAQRINKEQGDAAVTPEERANLQNLYTALMRKGQGIAIKADKDTPFTTVQRVFDNLLKNAVIYSYEGTEINIAVTRQGENAQITFTNHGDTIPEEKLERIFEQFYRLDASRSTSSGGAGLGLAIAKQIVELHKGTVMAVSENETAIFTVILPVL